MYITYLTICGESDFEEKLILDHAVKKHFNKSLFSFLNVNVFDSILDWYFFISAWKLKMHLIRIYIRLSILILFVYSTLK